MKFKTTLIVMIICIFPFHFIYGQQKEPKMEITLRDVYEEMKDFRKEINEEIKVIKQDISEIKQTLARHEEKFKAIDQQFYAVNLRIDDKFNLLIGLWGIAVVLLSIIATILGWPHIQNFIEQRRIRKIENQEFKELKKQVEELQRIIQTLTK
jgi:peptidoglycan hydrolase CwlO-like protein